MVGGVGVLRRGAQVEGDEMRGDWSASEVRNEVGTVFCVAKTMKWCNVHEYK